MLVANKKTFTAEHAATIWCNQNVLTTEGTESHRENIDFLDALGDLGGKCPTEFS
jgi:hypothetical protein